MAVPTITSLSPSRGPTAGRSYVEVTGTGFRVSPAPPATGVVPPPDPTVAVTFGGRAATAVEVVDATLLSLRSPIGDHGAGSTPLAADVVVTNLDDDGVPIPGETVTRVGGYTYFLPALTSEADFTRLVRLLILELRRQVCEETVKTVETDWSDDESAVKELTGSAKLPSISLIGPRLFRDGVRWSWDNPITQVGLETLRHQFAYTVDVEFTLVIATNDDVELLNLMAQTIEFFRRNPWIYMDRDPANLALGQVKYEMRWALDGELATTSTPNLNNLRSAAGRFVIYGFGVESLAGVAGDGIIGTGAIAETVETQLEHLGDC